ncbi:unnamed protein product [Rotaria sp. Silwood2]|nr:unnamed protein product [Rotaria sp. Silwood2]CAF4677709.1 unnamed protein product [Rotaria sp. Silwood2]CAF4790835.1 unnamed protein product [Rotaria sp. Silwood2]
MNLTREQIRVMIYYDYKKQLSQEECLESLHKTFGDSCVSRATVYNWFTEFSRGRDHFEDEPRAGRPRTVVTPENIEAVRGKNFQDINELHDAVRTQTDCLQKDDFYQFYEKWFERMNKCISPQGHYFEQI